MRYDITTEDGYIVSFGSASNGEPEDGNITKEQYDEIRRVITEKPTAADGYEYRLRADTLQWERVELPPAPTVYTQTSLETMTNAELEQILYGFGITASMNKANMIRLILAAQEGGAV